MEVSVSLPDEDAEYPDPSARAQGYVRSAALQHAVRLLRASELGAAYEEARAEWADGDVGNVGDATTADGLT